MRIYLYLLCLEVIKFIPKFFAYSEKLRIKNFQSVENKKIENHDVKWKKIYNLLWSSAGFFS